MCWLRSEFRVQEMISYSTYWTRNTTHPDSQWEYKLLWVVPSHNQNNRINAFDDNISPLCSFCRIVDRDSASRDSFNHFFLACPVTHNLLFQWTRSLNPPPDINSLDFKQLYWFRSVPLSNDETGTVTLCMDFFKYVIWKSKQRRRLPNVISVSREILFLIESACAQSRVLRHLFLNNNLIENLFQARG